MPAAKRITDPIFGDLKWEDLWWQGRVPLKDMPKPIELRVAAKDEDELPTRAQRAAYRALSNDRRGLWGALEAALWEYYRSFVARVYRRQMGPKDAALLTPELGEPREVWPLVSYLALEVPVEQRGPTVHFAGNCRWDEEHGFELVLRKGKYAGTA